MRPADRITLRTTGDTISQEREEPLPKTTIAARDMAAGHVIAKAAHPGLDIVPGTAIALDYATAGKASRVAQRAGRVDASSYVDGSREDLR